LNKSPAAQSSAESRAGKGNKANNVSGKVPGKKTTKSSTPSITLAEILGVLGLTFDKHLGILNGEVTHTLPSVATLEQLLKLVAKLNDQLEIVGEFDDIMINEITRLLNGDKQKTADVVVEGVKKENGAESDSAAGNAKDDDVEMEDVEEPEVKKKEKEEEEEEEEEQGEEQQQEIGEEEEQEDAEEAVLETEAPEDETAIEEVEKENKHDDDDDADKDEFIDANDQLDGEAHEGPLEKKRKFSTQQIENDPSVRNPKSEYVPSQTLPAAAHALGLFNDDDGGLHQFGEEYLKKKYAVSSYPKTDLKSKLPGVIPNIDFSKSKPSNQVQFATFQTFIENFYRQFTDDDLKFLKEKNIIPDSLANDSTYDPNITPYLIPHLGPLYSVIWNEEENAINYTPPPNVVTKESIIPRNASEDLNDETLESEKVSCGPLVSRLLSAILKDDKTDSSGGVENGTVQDDEDAVIVDSTKSTTAFPEQQGWKVSSTNTDYPTLEERLKRELRYIGIFMNLNSSSGEGFVKKDIDDDDDDDGELEPDWLNPEDDEISTELRRLQSELKRVSKRNNKRKKILLPVVERRLAWQEYLSILDDLEKQIDQVYVKRIRVPKNKKKKPNNNVTPLVQAQLASQTAHQAAANLAIRSLLEKRAKWMSRIGPLFQGEDEESSMKKYPKKSIFDSVDLDLDEDEEEDGVFDDGEDIVLQEQQ
jgi:transcriptional adapter 3